MSTPENPYDVTLWDPTSPEHAIEDPLHGSEALIRLLDTPPMPLPDGTYHVFGGYYLLGTNTFDVNGKPFIKFSSGSSMVTIMQYARLMEQWHETITSGELPEDYPANPADFFDLTAKPYIIFDKQ